MRKIIFICTCSFFFIFISCLFNKKVMVIGHRGAAGHEVENTIPSIDKAISFGVDAVEVDVFLCKSGELVVFHDENLLGYIIQSIFISIVNYPTISRKFLRIWITITEYDDGV